MKIPNPFTSNKHIDDGAQGAIIPAPPRGDNMKIEINQENPQESVGKIQEAFDELVDVINQQKQQLLENVKVIDDASEQIKNLTNSAVDFSDALKGVHMTLQAKKELFKDDEEINELLNTLAKFVVGSSAIKLGVISNARDKEQGE